MNKLFKEIILLSHYLSRGSSPQSILAELTSQAACHSIATRRNPTTNTEERILSPQYSTGALMGNSIPSMGIINQYNLQKLHKNRAILVIRLSRLQTLIDKFQASDKQVKMMQSKFLSNDKLIYNFIL